MNFSVTLDSFKIFYEVAKTLDNVDFIDCYDFITHEEKFFVDSRLHPNDFGFNHYSKNLCNKIQDLLKL